MRMLKGGKLYQKWKSQHAGNWPLIIIFIELVFQLSLPRIMRLCEMLSLPILMV